MLRKTSKTSPIYALEPSLLFDGAWGGVVNELLQETRYIQAAELDETDELIMFDELEAMAPSLLGSFQPLDAQITAARAGSRYGQGVQVAFSHHG